MKTFNITPIAKPRMVAGDKWKKRPIVQKYWAYKEELRLLANRYRYEVKGTLKIKFYLPMPKSWSQKKKIDMAGKPHQTTPDTDNLVKGFLDCITDDDAFVWRIEAEKRWAQDGKIETL